MPINLAESLREKRLGVMLAELPGITYAVVTDTSRGHEGVLVSVAVRGKGVIHLVIDRDRYDGLKLLDMIRKYG